MSSYITWQTRCEMAESKNQVLEEEIKHLHKEQEKLTKELAEWERANERTEEDYEGLSNSFYKLLKHRNDLQDEGQRLIDTLTTLKLTENSKTLPDSDIIEVVTNIETLRRITTAMENYTKLLKILKREEK